MRADTRRGDGIAAQMHAVGSSSQRYVEPIVHEHTRAGSPDGEHCRRHQLGQRLLLPSRAAGSAPGARRVAPPRQCGRRAHDRSPASTPGVR